MADEGGTKEAEGDKKIVHTYPLVKVTFINISLNWIYYSDVMCILPIMCVVMFVYCLINEYAVTYTIFLKFNY